MRGKDLKTAWKQEPNKNEQVEMLHWSSEKDWL